MFPLSVLDENMDPEDNESKKLMRFRKLYNLNLSDVEIPEIPENRTSTDKKSFILLGTVFLIMIALTGCTLARIDSRHFHYGVDDCGNFCGIDNAAIEEVPCSGKNYSDKPYTNALLASCVTKCEPTDEKLIGAFCIKRRKSVVGDFFNIIIALKTVNPWQYIVPILVTAGISFLALTGLTFVPAFLIWFTFGCCLIILIGVAMLFWYIYNFSGAFEFQLVASLWTLITIISVIIFVLLFKKLRVIVDFFRECIKFATVIPRRLLIMAIIAAIAQSVVWFLWAFFTTYMLTSVALKQTSLRAFEFVPPPITISALTMSAFVTAWMMKIVAGILYMTISGSIVSCYFNKSAINLNNAIFDSFQITTKYHLGTITMGSFFITLVFPFKFLFEFFTTLLCCKLPFTLLSKYISKMPFVQTAMHGQSFFKSSKRTMRLILRNTQIVLAVNCLSTFVLRVIFYFILVISGIVTFAMIHDNPFDSPNAVVLFILCMVLNISIASIVYTSYQSIVDTITICICEDFLLNDGLALPYLLPEGLENVIHKLKIRNRAE